MSTSGRRSITPVKDAARGDSSSVPPTAPPLRRSALAGPSHLTSRPALFATQVEVTLFPTPSSKIGILLAPPDEGDATPRGGKNASAPVVIDLMGASGELKVGDRLVRVDGVDVADQPSAVAEMQAKLAKLILTQAKLTLCVERESERKTSSTSRTRAKGSPRAKGGPRGAQVDQAAVELAAQGGAGAGGDTRLMERVVEEIDGGGSEVEPPPEVTPPITMRLSA